MFTLANLFLLQLTDTEPKAKGRALHWKQQVKWWESRASSSNLHRSQRTAISLARDQKKEHKKYLFRSIKALHLCNNHTHLHCKLLAICMQEISQTLEMHPERTNGAERWAWALGGEMCSPQTWGKSSPMSRWQSLNTQWNFKCSCLSPKACHHYC